MQKKRVFLGGTCNGSKWRDVMINLLREQGLDWFNTVVDNWDDDARHRELVEMETCDFCLYTITPKMTGVYSIAEVVDDSNKRSDKTVFVLLREDDGTFFNDSQWLSLKAVAGMVHRNGGKCFESLISAAVWMGERAKGE